jgi:hypothetical protein
MEELLVNAFVAGAAISGGELGRDGEAVMVLFFLVGGGLVAVEAVDALGCVPAHFVFVDDGVLRAGVTFGAFAGSTDESGARLLAFDLGPGSLNQKGCDDEGEGNDHCDEHGSKGHEHL